MPHMATSGEAEGLVAQSDGTDTEYFAYDGLGSVRQVADSSGAVLLAQTYDPYGNLYASAGVDSTAFGYAGEQEDANGLVFLRARYYNPAMGRFFQLDPSRQERNPYQYTLGNPVNLSDPSGLITQEQAESHPDGITLNADQILDLLETYGVKIYRDYGWYPLSWDYTGNTGPFLGTDELGGRELGTERASICLGCGAIHGSFNIPQQDQVHKCNGPHSN
jgi:RHS repeat-associated protein